MEPTLGIIILTTARPAKDYWLHSARSSQEARLTVLKRTTLKDAWSEEEFSRKISNMKVIYLPSLLQLQCGVHGQCPARRRTWRKQLEELELTYFTSVQHEGSNHLCRIMIPDNTCSLQSTAAFGEHERHSRATATGTRPAHTTVKELLGLQGFAYLIYLYFTYFPSLFSNKGF